MTAEFDTSQRAEQARAGVAAEQQGRGVAAQVALARRESPHRGQQHLGLARVLTREMPHTLAAFRQGRVSEWRTMLMARETACLELAERRAVDEEVAGAPAAFAALGDRQVVVACQRLAARLDQKAVVARRRRAESERRVSLRPAPETMSQLSALLPVAQGVAVYAALVRSADTARAGGDARSRGQIMADTLVERVTGQSSAPGVPLRVNLVLSDRTLLGPIGGGGGGDGDGGDGDGDGGDGDGDGGHGGADCGDGGDPAQLVAPVSLRPSCRPRWPAIWCSRAWPVTGRRNRVRTTLRRLYASPDSGQLVALESRSRLFPRALGELIRLRDQTCRTPWCDAPIRHTDHVVAQPRAGRPSYGNGQGLCQACNHAKQAPGWSARPRPGPAHEVETTTPTGHRYRSTAPPVLGPVPRPRGTRLEMRLADLVLIA